MTTKQLAGRTLAIGTSAAVVLGFAASVFALSANDYSLFGGAQYTTPGNASNRAVQLVSDATTTFSGVDYGDTSGLTFGDLSQLSSDYQFVSGSCVGGSPRFQINVLDPNTNTEKNIFAYFGTDSGGPACVTNGSWANTGNFLSAGRLLDTSQLTGGTFYDPYASALAKYSTYTVTGIQLVEDSGWTGTAQTVNGDNTVINSTTYTYEVPVPTNADQCKKGGYTTLADQNGNPFKNQGQCVSYVNTNKTH